MATEHHYDVIVLDIMLPGLNGYKVCEQLRDAGDWTPILMLTAKDGEYDHAEALDTGADDFLTKPFSFVVLLARVRALLRRSGRSRPGRRTSAGDLTIDPVTHRCTRGDVEVVLTAREFAVLEFLMRRAGEVVSKSEILDNVWDFAFEGDPNIVEVYIRHLRKKLDEPFDRHLIQTIRGAGYRLDPRRRLTRCAGSRPCGCASRLAAVLVVGVALAAGGAWLVRAQRAFADPERRDRRPAPLPRHRDDHRRRRLPRRAGRAHGGREPGAGRRRPGPRRRGVGEPARRGRAISTLDPGPSGYAARSDGPDSPRATVRSGSSPGASSRATGAYTVYVAGSLGAGRRAAPTA